MYQFVITTDRVNLPFTLHTILPRQEISIASSNDLLSEYSPKESTIMIEDVKEMDVDSFLDKV